MAQAAGLMQDPTAPVSELKFSFSQDAAIERGVLVASFWWRDPIMEELRTFADENDCDLVPVSDLIHCGDIQVIEGHGSPSSHYKGKGDIPYVKVVDIKNWRVNEELELFHATRSRRKVHKEETPHAVRFVDSNQSQQEHWIVRSSYAMGRTEVILTREVFIWRIRERGKRIDRWLFLALASLKVVHDQFKYLVLMQMNREDLGRRYRELLLPIPRTRRAREKWSAPVRRYFEAQTAARTSYNALTSELDPSLFTDRP